MKNPKSMYHGHRFPPEIISYAVWLYHRFCLSLRDVEYLLAKREVAKEPVCITKTAGDGQTPKLSGRLQPIALTKHQRPLWVGSSYR